MRHRSIRKTTVTILAALAACWLAADAFAQEVPEAEPEKFYYADGEKVSLTVSTEYLAVRLRPSVDPSAFLEPTAEPIETRAWRSAGTLPRHRLVLYRLREGYEADASRSSRRALTARPEVEEEAPVFTVGEERYLQILTDEFVARFGPGVTARQIVELNERHAVEVVREDRYEENQLILRVTPASGLDALEAANLYHESELTLWATPNFISETRKALVPNDTHYSGQQHLENTGQSGGTAGEDVDAEDAWDLSLGNHTVVIAVLDDGVDYNHPDLQPNIFRNPGEVPGDNLDNDGNGFVDDLRGWDFYDDDNDPIPSTFNSPYDYLPNNDIHGTPCAGVAAARINNSLGVAGIAGNSRILPIKIFGGTTTVNLTSNSDLADAIRYAGAHADILSNSWHCASSTLVTSAFQDAVTNGRGGRGAVILCASGNGYSSSVAYPARLTTVTAVGASTNQGVRASYSNYGAELDIVAPSSGGTRGITTTDVSIANRGYDDLDAAGLYTSSFGGTSSATPLAAGVAALVLSMHPTLTRAQVQDVLEDTAEKIDAVNAAYDATTGHSNQYGHGRVNARDAMGEARERRLQGVDVYARDRNADVGDTPTAWPWFWSPDIKVDALDDQTPANFGQVVHESAASGQSNTVYVQVHNRGAATAASVTVHLYWTFAGTGLPALPTQFWNQYPGPNTDTTFIHPLGQKSITNLAPGAPQYVTFPWVAPAIDLTKNDPHHHCLFAIVDSPQDEVFTRLHHINTMVRNDNNIALHNVNVEEVVVGDARELTFFAGNPFLYELAVELGYSLNVGREPSWTIDFVGYDHGKTLTLQPGEQRLIRLRVEAPTADQEVELTVIQRRADTGEPMGGVTYRLRSRQRRWSFSLHAGAAIPQGAARRTLDDGSSLILDLGYRLKPRWSLVGLLGWSRFDTITGGDFDWLNVSTNLRYDFQQAGQATYYFGAGPGLYVPEAGATKFGAKLGLGVDVRLTPALVLEIGGDAHQVFDSDLEFLQFHAGLIFGLR